MRSERALHTICQVSQPGVPVVSRAERHYCGSADVGADVGEGVGGDVGGSHNA